MDCQPLYRFIKDSTLFHWPHEHEKLSPSIKNKISEDTILVVPSTDYVFHFPVASLNFGCGCNLVQQFLDGNRIISFNSRLFDKAERIEFTHHRKLSGIVAAVQFHEHYMIGASFPINLYCDHKPILHLWGRKGQVSHRFFRYQVIVTRFQSLKILWTPWSNFFSWTS